MDIRTFCKIIKAKQLFNYLLITEYGGDFDMPKVAEAMGDSKFSNLMLRAAKAAGFTFAGLGSYNGLKPEKILEWVCIAATGGIGSPLTALQPYNPPVINLQDVLEQGNVYLANGKFWFTTRALPEAHPSQTAELPTFDMQRTMIEAVLSPDCTSYIELFTDVCGVHAEMRRLCAFRDFSANAKDLLGVE